MLFVSIYCACLINYRIWLMCVYLYYTLVLLLQQNITSYYWLLVVLFEMFGTKFFTIIEIGRWYYSINIIFHHSSCFRSAFWFHSMICKCVNFTWTFGLCKVTLYIHTYNLNGRRFLQRVIFIYYELCYRISTMFIHDLNESRSVVP